MSEPDRGLMVELRDACRSRDGAQKDYDEYISNYKVELAEKKEVLKKARNRVAEIESDLVGQSNRPLLDAATKTTKRAAGRKQ